MELSRNETLVLKFLSALPDNFVIERNIAIGGLDERAVSSAVSYLIQKDLVAYRFETTPEYSLGREGMAYVQGKLPEEVALEILKAAGKADLDAISNKLGEHGARIAIAQLARLGVKPSGGMLAVDPAQISSLEKEISRRRKLLEDILAGRKLNEDPVLEELLRRKDVVLRDIRKSREIKILRAGLDALSAGGDKIENLTAEVLQSGEWKTRGFREYDLNPKRLQDYSFPGPHPLTLFIDRIRRIFLQMGFREMSGDYMETALWNMDALFIPQNHPARDMQDTFYLEGDIKHPLSRKDREYQKIFSRVHEHGIPGYMGWGTKWDPKESERLLLRTHTTVNTIRYMAEHPEQPQAVFSVDSVFRHESMDWTHLAELHQIEGAVLSDHVSLGTLKWIIREFFTMLGLKNIRFIPSYYPYTEPSMDIVAEINGREVELGGSGIFRPEVTLPLGLKHKVMAWGMGLERFAMLYYGLNDIRDIYRNDLGWLMTYKIPLVNKK